MTTNQKPDLLPKGSIPQKVVVVYLEGWGPFTVPAEARASELMWWPSDYFPTTERVWWRGNEVLWHPDEGWNEDYTVQADPVITFRDGDHIILAPKGYF